MMPSLKNKTLILILYAWSSETNQISAFIIDGVLQWKRFRFTCDIWLWSIIQLGHFCFFFFFCGFHDLNTFKDYRRIQFADSHSIWFNVSSEADSLCTSFEKISYSTSVFLSKWWTSFDLSWHCWYSFWSFNKVMFPRTSNVCLRQSLMYSKLAWS